MSAEGTVDYRQQLALVFANRRRKAGIFQGVREFRSGVFGKRIVLFASRLNDGLIPCESRLEAAHCLHLEFDRSVLAYQGQPLTIALPSGAHYTPDFAVLYLNRRIDVHEVKLFAQRHRPATDLLLSEIRSVLDNQGVRFQLLTEEELLAEPRLANLHILYRCAHGRYAPTSIDLAVRHLKSLGEGATWEAFRALLQEHGFPPLLQEYLVLTGRAQVDLDRPISAQTRIGLV